MILGVLGALFPFLKSFLGEGVIQSVLAHKRDLAASANEAERMRIEADVKVLEFELERRKTIRDLQLKEMEHGYLWWPKFLIMMAVALYVVARFSVKTWGLEDFGVGVTPLNDWEAAWASAVMAYLFLGGPLSRAMAK